MLHELFLGLLGFTGDILVWSANGNSMHVKDGFDLLTSGERDQINKLAPLGWYYVKLQEFVDEYSLQWGSKRNSGRLLYRAALSQGVADLLEEYTADVVYLEQIVLKDGPVPLSQVLLHLQKYLVCMPPIYSLMLAVEKKGLHGCQILDHFTRFQSGSPAVMDTVRHLLVRVRNVFLKQCVGWMLYGSLDDQSSEFFVRRRSSQHGTTSSANKKNNTTGGSRGTGDEALESFFHHMEGSGVENKVLEHFSKLFKRTPADTGEFVSPGTGIGGLNGSSSSSASSDSDSFDWASTYVLKMENLPETHITPGLASKVLFAGKAVMLLQRVSGQEKLHETDRDVYRYLSGEGSTGFKSVFGKDGQHYSFLSGVTSGTRDSTPFSTNSGGETNSTTAAASKERYNSNGEYIPESRRGKPNLNPTDDPEGTRSQLLREHTMRCGYTPEQVDIFTRGFHLVLHKENMAVEVLEGLIEDIHAAISAKLWATLRDSFGFHTTLSIVRSTFLMGKGELYQLLLDGITAQTFLPPRDARQANLCLNWKVVRGASAIVGLPDDALSRVFRLRVNSYHMSIHAATAYIQATANANHRKNHSDSENTSETHVNASELAGLGDEDVCGVLFGGNATVTAGSNGNGSVGTGSSCVFSMCPVPAVTPESEVEKLFQDHILHRSKTSSQRQQQMNMNKTSAESVRPSPQVDQMTNKRVYSVGALWLSEPKYLSKGFKLLSHFHCDWAVAATKLHSTHPWLVESCSGAFDGEESTIAGDSSVASHPYSMTGSMSVMTNATISSQRDNYIKTPAARRSLILGCLTCCIHTDRRGTQMGVLGSDVLGIGVANSIVAGAAFHVKLHRNKPQMFIRVFVAIRSTARTSSSRRNGGSTADINNRRNNGGFDGASTVADMGDDGAYNANMRVLAETLIGVDDYTGEFGRSVSGSSPLQLEVEYSRNSTTATPRTNASVGGSVTAESTAGTARTTSATGVYYTMKVRVIESSSSASPQKSQQRGLAASDTWDVSTSLEIPNYLKLQGGEATLGLTSSGLLIPDTEITAEGLPSSFGTYITSLQFDAKTSLDAYPVASPFTISRYPETYVRLEKELGQIRAWLGIQLRVAFPPIFHVIFDSEALAAYQRLFSLLMRIRLVAHSLERLWKTRSRLSSDRVFCQLRHSMHFFISNFLYYLQVDVVDSEYAALVRDVAAANDFQQVLRIHRNFLATVLRVSLVDNVTVQDSIERVLQSCLRFIAVCRLLHQQEFNENNKGSGNNSSGNDYYGDEDLQRFRQDTSPVKVAWHNTNSSPLFHPTSGGSGTIETFTESATASTPNKSTEIPAASYVPVVVPPEEVESIRKEFFLQMNFLFQIMRKVENRGFMFRLDYNEYFSGMTTTSASVPAGRR
jgi:hypothetical protein